MGRWYVFTFGGMHRPRCGLTPNARVVGTLPDAYRMDGVEIPPDPSGVVQTRTVDHTTGTVVSISTVPHRAVYISEIHTSISLTPR